MDFDQNDGKNWEQMKKKLFSSQKPIWRESFYILSLSLLSLLFPLSFLLLARLSNLQYLITFAPYLKPPSSLLLSLFLYLNPSLLLSLVSFISLTSLLHGLTGRYILIYRSRAPARRPRLFIAWIFLCILQLCVGLGLEGTISARVWPRVDQRAIEGTVLLSRIIFLVGLNDTMLYWSRIIIRPVIDDAICGVFREERWVERAAMAASLGGLWWWRLRDEIEGLVVAVEVKRELSISVGMSDVIGWWLYYVIVTIGMVRLVKGIFWFGDFLFCREVEGSHGSPCGNEDKV